MVTIMDYAQAWRGPSTSPTHVDCDPVLKTLGSFARLSSEEVGLLTSLRRRNQTYHPGQEISRADELNPKSSVIAEGWAARVRMLPDGRRQILAVLLPGDCVAVTAERGALDRPALIALTRVAVLDATPLRDHLQEPEGRVGGLAKACAGAQDELCQMLIDHVVRLGRHSTYERLIDFLDELHRRQRRAGLASADRMPLPLTQDVLSDILGVSLVHVNRTLQAMRRDGVLVVSRGHVDFRKPAADEATRRSMSFQPASDDRTSPVTLATVEGAAPVNRRSAAPLTLPR